MRRNSLERVAKLAIRRAAVERSVAAGIAPGISGDNDSQEVGSNGPDGTDAWASYGLTGFTQLGNGFRVKAGEKDW